MVEKKLEKEVKEILTHIEDGHNFLLSGGAGSGKTYSLVQVVKEVIRQNPKSQVACITYTNAAVREIKERVGHQNLRVSTIHDFLWDMIKSFQREIKICLLELINEPESKIPKPDASSNELYDNPFEGGIQYQEYLDISKGVISHNEVLLLGNLMYEKYIRLCDIFKDKFQFIFLDEYQDTSPLIIEILLDHLNKSKKRCIIGFFGDSMQSIYDDGIGDLNKYIESGEVVEVQKMQNRRNPQSVIELANRLRLDSLRQEVSKDDHAPNMNNGKVKQGSIKFLYSQEDNIDIVKNSDYFNDWDFSDAKSTKELNLTHNLIATKAQFRELMDIYDKDPIIELKKEIVKKIKNENISIDENLTFADVVKQVPIYYKKEMKKIDWILLQAPINRDLYNFLQNRPFSEVREIYLDKDSLIDDKKDDPDDNDKKNTKRDKLIKHLFKIQDLIYYYKSKDYNTFLRKTDYKINNVADKKKINDIIEKINNMENCIIEKVIDFADASGLCKKDDHYNDFVKNNSYVFYRVCQVKFNCFQNLYDYLEGFTPFSTQHKVKGTEFSNVLVILDNGKWNQYDYASLFACGSENEKVIKRTHKLFYVCCTRTKNNLAVYYHNPSSKIIENAKKLFGEDNVHHI
ncbi:MAG: AAA family ATPase [Bacteroidales bacterium]|jgi:DNA helicase-2/ATP-dependent DNA helicase PcrA|nr:AAA family ATPase [Bacteroidales bacterium]